jgi:pilus assembly protein Flp/PilA
MKKVIARFAADESGSNAIEYGLIGGLIAIVIIGALQTLGGKLKNQFNSVSNSLS